MRELPEQQRSQERLIRFDEQIVADASFEDLDPALVDQFRTPRTRDDRQTLARKLAIAAPDVGELVPTVAGLLIGARNPERWLCHAFIQAAAYRGRGVSDSLKSPYYQLDARDIVRHHTRRAGDRRLPLCHEEPDGGGAQDDGPR